MVGTCSTNKENKKFTQNVGCVPEEDKLSVR
jgi:hypothetical protein